jgi:NAD(P)-dependent dehydrogenase (short-subunit alcohol dehydrogenase family)
MSKPKQRRGRHRECVFIAHFCLIFTVASELKAETGYSKAELWIIDLADFASVKHFADRFEREGGRLDILVENAAIGSFTHKLTNDGWDIS